MGNSISQRSDYNSNGPNIANRPPPFERNGWVPSTNTTPMLSHPPPNMMASNGIAQTPIQSGGMPPQNGGATAGKTSTQVTIPKDVRIFLTLRKRLKIQNEQFF